MIFSKFCVRRYWGGYSIKLFEISRIALYSFLSIGIKFGEGECPHLLLERFLSWGNYFNLWLSRVARFKFELCR